LDCSQGQAKRSSGVAQAAKRGKEGQNAAFEPHFFKPSTCRGRKLM
jgi:hypothetical protein